MRGGLSPLSNPNRMFIGFIRALWKINFIMNRNTAIALIAVVLVVVAGIVLLAGLLQGNNTENGDDMQSPPTTTPPETQDGGPVTEPSVPDSTPEGELKVLEITGVEYDFSIEEIRVKRGDRVRIEFTSQEGLHDLVIDAFDVRTQQVSTGQSDVVEFVADEAGTFEYYCSVNNHRQLGMVGTLIVE